MSNKKKKPTVLLGGGHPSVKVLLLFVISLILTTVVTLVFSNLMADTAQLGSFMYSTLTGLVVIYNFAFLLTLLCYNVLDHSSQMVGESANRMYYFMRLGYSAAQMIDSALKRYLLVPLLSYLCGLAVTCGVGLLIGMKFYLNGFIAICAFGLVSVLTMALYMAAVGVVFRSRIGHTLMLLLFAGLFVGYCVLLDMFVFTDRAELSRTFAAQMTLSGATYLTVASVLSVVMVTVFFFTLRDACAFYYATPLKQASLDRMGISKNIRVTGRKRRVVAEGSGAVSKRGRNRWQTTMTTLSREKPESRPVKGKKSGPRIVLSVVAALLLVVLAVGLFLLRSVGPGMPISLFGYTAVGAAEPVQDAGTGDLLIFRHTDRLAFGDLVCYTQGGRTACLKYLGDSGDKLLLEGSVYVTSDEYHGRYVGTVPTLNSLHLLLQGAAGIGIIAALVLGALALLVFGAFRAPKAEKRQPTRV